MTRPVLVIDACTALKWFLPEPHAIRACRLLDRRAVLIAPDSALLEVANVLARKQRSKELTGDQAQHILERLPKVLDELLPLDDVLHLTRQLAVELEHPAYDTLYLACAIVAQGKVITADDRFARRVARSAYAHRLQFLPDMR